MTHCGNRRKIYRWLDGVLRGEEAQDFGTHLKQCSFCRQELESARAFHGLLKTAPAFLEPSEAFEADFWKKAFAREREPWFSKLMRDLDSLIPVPNLAQALGAVLLAVFIGGGGGFLSVLGALTPQRLEGRYLSVQYLSGFQEFKGLPASTITVSYMKVAQGKEIQK